MAGVQVQAQAPGLGFATQQAVMQVLQRRWDRTFSEYSYGFRPGRSPHQAVAQAQQYIAADYSWVVDLDLEKFLDRVASKELPPQVPFRFAPSPGGPYAVEKLLPAKFEKTKLR